MKKGILCILCLCFIICLLPMDVLALEVPELDREGSISITMEYENEKIPGGSLTIYRVGNIQVENGADYSFAFTAEYAQCGYSLEDVADPKLAESLAAYTIEKGITGTTKTIDANGNVTFAELKPGLYLFVQKEAAPGYYPANPFLVSLPGKSDTGYEYQVNASPKLELEPKPTTPPEPTLPQTGQVKWPVPVFAVLGALLVGCGVLLRRKESETDAA